MSADHAAWTADERLSCPECSRLLWASELCECDDDDTGPLCARCCREWHRDDRSAA